MFSAIACSVDVVKVDEINKELERLTNSLQVMEQSLAASDSAVKLAEQTLQKHKDGFKIKMNEKHQELLNAQAATKKVQEELDHLVQENKEIDDAVFGKYKCLSFLSGGIHDVLFICQLGGFVCAVQRRCGCPKPRWKRKHVACPGKA